MPGRVSEVGAYRILKFSLFEPLSCQGLANVDADYKTISYDHNGIYMTEVRSKGNEDPVGGVAPLNRQHHTTAGGPAVGSADALARPSPE